MTEVSIVKQVASLGKEAILVVSSKLVFQKQVFREICFKN